MLSKTTNSEMGGLKLA
jgi:hypothetical protein